MSDYIHGTEPEEQARLSKLNDLINIRCMNLLDIKEGDQILDVGSGLGQLTLLMAEKAGPLGKCLGIERDKNQLKTALQHLKEKGVRWAEFRQGNAESLELDQEEWGNFDLAHARFVLEHVRQPESIIEGMAKAVRPGGRVVVADDDHEHLRLYPSPAGFSTLWEAYIRSYDRLGNDPYVGRRLVSLLYQNGLRNIRNNVVFFGDSGESPTFPAYITNLVGILEGARGLMERHTLIDTHTFDEAIQNLWTWSQRSDAALWYTINWVEGIKP